MVTDVRGDIVLPVEFFTSLPHGLPRRLVNLRRGANILLDETVLIVLVLRRQGRILLLLQS